MRQLSSQSTTVCCMIPHTTTSRQKIYLKMKTISALIRIFSRLKFLIKLKQMIHIKKAQLTSRLIKQTYSMTRGITMTSLWITHVISGAFLMVSTSKTVSKKSNKPSKQSKQQVVAQICTNHCKILTKIRPNSLWMITFYMRKIF